MNLQSPEHQKNHLLVDVYNLVSAYFKLKNSQPHTLTVFTCQYTVQLYYFLQFKDQK